MKAIELKGIIPPILTPMHDDESINVEELRLPGRPYDRGRRPRPVPLRDQR